MGLKLWSKLAKTSLDALDKEQAVLFSDKSYMTLRYELAISCSCENYHWREALHFADRPEVDVLKMLKEQASNTFFEFFEMEPESIYMELTIIEPDNREQLPTIRK